MAVKDEFEKLNKRKDQYRVVDDDTIASLVRYYKLGQDKNELLRFIKESGAMKDDNPNEQTTKGSLTWHDKQDAAAWYQITAKKKSSKP